MPTDERIHRCPFCRGADRLYIANQDRTNRVSPNEVGPLQLADIKAWVYCANCWANGPMGDTDEEAIARWNVTADAVPDWLPGDHVELKYDVYIDGVLFGTGTRGVVDTIAMWTVDNVLVDFGTVREWMSGDELTPIGNYRSY